MCESQVYIKQHIAEIPTCLSTYESQYLQSLKTQFSGQLSLWWGFNSDNVSYVDNVDNVTSHPRTQKVTRGLDRV